MNTQEFASTVATTLENPLQRIPVKISHEPVIMADGIAMNSVKVKNASDGMKATMLMMMKHCADVHLTILEIIGEKYGLDVDEMCNTVKDHPRWTQLLLEPMIHDLTEIARETACQSVEKEIKKVVPKKKTAVTPPVKPKAKKPVKEVVYED